MKRIIIAAAFVTLATAPQAWGQTDAERIERALMAAPEQSRQSATVIDWNPDHTYRTLKEGTTPLVCYDWSGELGEPAFSVQCTSKANLPRVAQSRQFAEESADRAALQARHRAAEEDGSRIAPEFGSLFTSMTGPDRENARMHTTIAVPGATAASLGLPEDAAQGGAWIMQAGSSYAHIMTPGH
jgi:Ni/Co efflux regulator RcnB